MAATRRLAAIMFTDLVGFSASAQSDESSALLRLREQEELLRPLLSEHRGREVKSTGDGFLVEFDSALKATQCAIEIQRRMHERNSRSDRPAIQLRVGIHLGDVEEHGGDIFGDAVNIAARLEPLAEPGGVCISQQVFDQVRNKIPNRLEKLPPRELKNLKSPIDVYRIALPWETPAAGPDGAGPTRIAILPFSNISPDANDGYFADGMTDELISTLSRIGGLRVISRTSVIRYKNTSKALREIATELNVANILEGSVRKVADDLRITAQLIDAATDEHLWSQDFDMKLQDVFRVQKEIATSVAQALEVRLVSAERRDIERPVSQSGDAYIRYLQGRQLWYERRPASNDRARAAFEEAVRLDPKFALAYSGLADCYLIAGDYSWMGAHSAFPRAKGYLLRALELEPDLAEAHATLAAVLHNYEGNLDLAEQEFRRAIQLKPSYVLAHMWYALFLLGEGRFDEAGDELDRVQDVDPLSWLLPLNRTALLSRRGDRPAAIDGLRTLVEKFPDRPHAHSSLGIEYLLAGRTQEGVEELHRALSLPGLNPVERAEIACALGYAGRKDEAQRMLDSLQTATQTDQFLNPVLVAKVLFSLGRRDDGFASLTEAEQQGLVYLSHASALSQLRFYPWFEEVRRDPRWAAFEGRLAHGRSPRDGRG